MDGFHLVKLLVGPVAPVGPLGARPVASQNSFKTSQKSFRAGRSYFFRSTQNFRHFLKFGIAHQKTNESTSSYQNRSGKSEGDGDNKSSYTENCKTKAGRDRSAKLFRVSSVSFDRKFS